MLIEQKNIMVEQYIDSLINDINKKYSNLISENMKQRAIEIYTNSDKEYEKIIEELNEMAQQTIKNYLNSIETKKELLRKQEIDKLNERNSRTFEQIKAVQQKVQKLLDEENVKIYISGGSVPYLLMNQDSNRLHDDIDTICSLEDMQKLREVFKNAGLYQEEWDSMTFANDGKDYGFEMKIDGVPFGIYPFKFQNGVLTQYSYDPYNKQCKIKTLPLEKLSDYVMTYKSVNGNLYDTMSLEFIKMTKDNAGREKDIVDSQKISQTGLLRKDVLDRIEMYTEVQKIEADKLNSSIQMTPELNVVFNELISTSLLSSRQALEKYSVDSDFSEHIKQVQDQQQQMLAYVQQIRKNNPNLSDEVFYKQMMVSFLSPVVQKINDQYGQMIPQNKLQKLNGLLNPQNITFTFDKNQNDIQANSEKGQLLINPQKTLGSTLEEKIVCSMGASIHESFHLLVNMLKSPEQAEKIGERLMYTIATTEGDKEVHFAPGKYGQVLSEGFVEKLSSEFARQNGFYYTLNPSYIPYVELCSQLMNQDKSIDTQFLFTKTGDDIVSKMTPEVKSKFEETERLVVINNFETKESRRKDSLKGITSECVKTSWMERKGVVQEVKTNESFKKPLEIKRQESKEQRQQSIVDTQQPKKEPEFKTFQKKKEQRQEQQRNINQMSQSHQETYHQQTQITQQHNQSKAMEKPKVKTLTKSNNSSGSSSGFVDTLILTLITGFVAGAIFMIVYYICK